MYPFLFAVTTVLSLFLLLKAQPAGRRTIFEPGFLLVGLFSLCYLLPTLIIVSGMDFYFPIDESYINKLSIYGVLFSLSFSIFYSKLKNLSFGGIVYRYSTGNYLAKDNCFLLFLIIFFITKIVSKFYGIGNSGEYGDQYLIRLSMPSYVSQILNMLESLKWMLIYIIFSYGFDFSLRDNSLRIVFITWTIFLLDMLLTNSRSNFVTYCIVAIAAYIFYNRPFGIKKEIFASFFFILALGCFSFIRDKSFGSLGLSMSQVLVPSEFLSIYANAMHFLSIIDTNDYIPPPGNPYLESLISFAPKQINTEKWDLASWYVNEYFPDFAEAGGGLAFGIIPEAIVTWREFSIIFQSFIIAAIFRVAYLSADQVRSFGPNVWVLFYFFCFSQVYQLIRANSFSIIASTVLGFVVPYLMLIMISKLFSKNCLLDSPQSS